jgi:FeS assembly SUF system protein
MKSAETPAQIQDDLALDFELLENWEDRYQYLLELAKECPPLPNAFKNDSLLIKGCQSKVWLRATCNAEGRMDFAADSDALLVKGIITLLLKVFQHQSPEAILETRFDLHERTGLQHHLSPNRANGLAGMLDRIRQLALLYRPVQENLGKPSPRNLHSSMPSQNDSPQETNPASGLKSSSQSTANPTFIEIQDAVLNIIKTIYDPEIPVNIYDLGLIYNIEVQQGGKVLVTMTLTSPSCPVAGTLPGEVEDKMRGVHGVNEVKVELTFDPPWSQDLMSEEAKLELGFL